MPAGQMVIEGDLGKNVWESIRGADLRAVVELRPDGSEGRRQSDEGADELIRVLDAHSHRRMFVSVIGDAKLGGPRVRQTHSNVLILVVGNGEICGNWAYAGTVRGHPTPRLPTKELPST